MKVSQSGSYDQVVGVDSPVDVTLMLCKTVADGFTADAGTLESGEIVLRLTTPDNTYYTGPGSRNPDGIQHAQVQKLSSTTIRVSWEDLFDGGDQDFNDCVVDVVASEAAVASAPPSAPVAAQLGVGVALRGFGA